MNTTPAKDRPAVEPLRDFWMPDYCPKCNPLAHNADRCVRLATQTEPDTVMWRGGKRVVCEYECPRCQHTWTRSDLWTAKSAGFVPNHRRAA